MLQLNLSLFLKRFVLSSQKIIFLNIHNSEDKLFVRFFFIVNDIQEKKHKHIYGSLLPQKVYQAISPGVRNKQKNERD